MQAFIQNAEAVGVLIVLMLLGVVGYYAWHRHKIAEEHRLTLAAQRKREHALAMQEVHKASQEQQKSLMMARQVEHASVEVDVRRHQMYIAERIQQIGGTVEWTANGFRASGVSVKQIDAPVQRAQIAAPGVYTTPTLPRPLVLPSAYDLIDVFRRYEIMPDNIFMAAAMGKRLLWIDSKKGLCHGIFNAITGRGKTIVERGIEMQLLACNLEVWHMDIKFSLIDEEGLDYRPIARRLLSQPDTEITSGHRVSHLLTDPTQIRDSLEWVATVDIPRRLKMYRIGDHSYSILYLFLEELLYLLKLFPEIATFIETIIVVGRSLGVKLFTAAQNFQTQNTNISGGMRDNFETAIYLGGDDVSGASILDMGRKELTDYLKKYDAVLGKGVTMMRNNTVLPKAELVRTGMASNDALYYLLGRADGFVLPEMRGVHERDTEPSQNAYSPETKASMFEHRNRVVTGGLVNEVRPLVRTGEGSGETHQISEPYVSLTNAERTTILAAAQAQMKLTGKPKANRSQLIRDLNEVDKSWNNKAWDKVKIVLDEKGW